MEEGMDRKFNRPRKSQLELEQYHSGNTRAKKHAYKQVKQKVAREKKIKTFVERVELKKNLAGKGKRKRFEDEDGVVTWKWKKERRR